MFKFFSTKKFILHLQVFRKALTQMFESMEQDVVFMETSMGLRYHPHMYIECIPVEKETGDLAPIYFKVIMFNIDSLLIMFINASVFKNFVHCVQLNRLKCL